MRHAFRLFFLLSVLAGLISLPATAFAGAAEGVEAMERGDYALGFQHLVPAAKSGDALAQYHLARAYEFGYGVAPNVALAARWYAEAAGRGHVEANVRVGKMNLTGEGLTRDAARAADFFAYAARSGHGEAAYLLAVLYLEGMGVPKSARQGIDLLNHAASLNYPAALNHLGTFYATGESGIPIHRGRAFELYHQAAARGNGDAMLNLGQAYLSGQGLPEDPKQAYLWLGLAAGYGALEVQTLADRLRRDAARKVPAREQALIDERIRNWQPLKN